MKAQILFVLSLAMAGCASHPPSPTNLEHSYNTGFQSLRVPTDEQIEQRSIKRELPSSLQTKLWQASLAVVMQRGPIVRVDEARKVIVAPPYLLRIGRQGNNSLLHCVYMDEMFFGSQYPWEEVFFVEPGEKQRFANEVLEAVVTEASADANLRRGGKWGWMQ